jgi:FkbM family methyltransferase
MRKKCTITNFFYEKLMLMNIQNNYKSGSIVDVGANVGNHAVFFCGVVHDHEMVYAIEPGPDALRLLKRNLKRNGVSGKVVVQPVAAGAFTGTVSMQHGSSTNLGAMRVAAVTADRSQPTPMERLDDIIPESRTLAVMKIDVEGFEVEALSGAQRILASQKPDIYVEAARPEAFERVHRLLAEYSYTRKGVFNDTPTHWFCARA